MTIIKYIKNTAISLILLLLVQCEPVVPQQSVKNKIIFFDNHDYEEVVGNVNLIPVSNGTPDYLETPIIRKGSDQQLLLDFDLLSEEFENLSFRIIHCNRGWKKSLLRDMEYLNEINNYRITEFDYSQSTLKSYVRYRGLIPSPSLSGNYIVAIYRRANPNDVLFTRKFMVVDPSSVIDHTVRVPTTIDKRDINHQLEFTVNYGNVFVNSPIQDISISILQNHRWQTAIHQIPPTLIRPNENYMEFRHLDEKTNFNAWNEFRFFDLRTLNVNGRNVAKIVTQNDQLHALLGADKTRSEITYTQTFQDINGNYLIQNSDVGENSLNADYANVHFFLKENEISGNVYLTGRFNNWKMDDSNRMRYDPTRKGYTTNITLKQGYYDYQYFVESTTLPSYYFEGSHHLAENEYEIFVYYRRPGNVNDEIIGYKKFRSRQL
ncbi:MAG: type IX secretion system plug protein domain-containing protein [Ekhidna sp.]